MDVTEEESAAELALEAALSFLDDYEAIAAEWLAPADQVVAAGTVLDRGEGLAGSGMSSGADSAAGVARPAPGPQRKSSAREETAPAIHRGGKTESGTRNSNRARDERKYELIYLRRHVDELETRLRELRSHATAVAGLSLDGSTLEQSFKTSTPATHGRFQGSQTWKEAARRRWAERQQAEKENIRLRLLVDRQLKTAKRLEKVVRRKRGARIKEADPETASVPAGAGACVGGDDGRDPRRQRRSLLMDMMPNPVLFGSTEQTLDMLLQAARLARDEMDAVFRANGLSAIDCAYRSARVGQDETNGTMLEFVSCKTMKADVHTAHQVAWRHFGYSQPQMPYRTLSEYHDERKDMDFAEDTIAASYGLELFHGLESVKFDEWRVLRRFVDVDRVILVLCTLAEVIEFAGVPAKGIRVLERAFVVLRPSSSDGTENKSMVMQTCYQTQPVMYKDSPGLEETVATLTDFLFAFVAGTVSVNNQMIEKALRAQASQAETSPSPCVGVV